MMDFKDSKTFRKSNGELEKALKNPYKIVEMLEEAHEEVKTPNGEKTGIRIQGHPQKVVETIKELNLEENVNGIYKNFKDKDKREEINPNEIRAYINVKDRDL